MVPRKELPDDTRSTQADTRSRHAASSQTADETIGEHAPTGSVHAEHSTRTEHTGGWRISASADVHAAPHASPLSQAIATARQLIIDRFAPAAVLVDRNHEILYVCGPTEDYLKRPSGMPSNNLLASVRDGLLSNLREALGEAARCNAPSEVAGARMKRDDHVCTIDIAVAPRAGGSLGLLFLVVFRHAETAANCIPLEASEPALVRQLEAELEATRLEFQGNIDSLWIENQDLRQSNEEIIARSEELISRNAALERWKLEAGEVIARMASTNRKLEGEVRRYDEAGQDLQNLLANIDVAIIGLDTELNIKWFSPATRKLFNILPVDVGRPLADLTLKKADPHLDTDVRKCLEDKEMKQYEFQSSQGRWYIRRVRPFGATPDAPDGTMITYIDVTDTKIAQEAANARRKTEIESAKRTMREQASRLRELSAALSMAEERERRDLAQDLHDDLGQLVALIGLKVEAMFKQRLSPTQRKSAESCAKAVSDANRKLREMAFKLSPPMLYDLGLAAALEWLAEEMRQMYRLEVAIKDEGMPALLEPSMNATLFRSIRELLINAAKHAGVREARVSIGVKRGSLIVSVADDGPGFDPCVVLNNRNHRGFGLASIHERLNYLSGQMKIRSGAGKGTCVTMSVPLAAASEA